MKPSRLQQISEVQMDIKPMSDDEWQEFHDWCKERYKMWTPNRLTIEIYRCFEETRGDQDVETR